MVEILISQPDTKKIDLVNSNFNESKSWLNSSRYLDEFPKYFDSYRGIPRGKKNKWMSNKFIPDTFGKVETAISMLYSLLFAANPPFQVRPFESTDEKSAKVMEKLLSYQFEQANVSWEFAQFIRTLCIYGTAVAKVCWDEQFAPQIEWQEQYRFIMNPMTGTPIIDPNTGEPGAQYTGNAPVETNNISFRGPRMINLNISDVFPDPMSIDVQDGWIIHRTFRTRDYLIKMHENYPDVYNDEVLKLTAEDGTNKNEAMMDTEKGLGRLSNTSVTRPEGTERIPILERWGLDVDPIDGKLKSRVITIASGNRKIRDTNNPYWHNKNPFIKGVYIPSVNDFYGIGVAELLFDLQNMKNEMVNQRTDNISLALNRIIIYKKGSGIKIDNLRSEPGIRIGTDEDIDKSIKFLDTPIYTRDSFQHTADIDRWEQEVSAVTKLTLGMAGSDQNDTATGMSILQKASGDRFMTIAKVLETTAFKEVIRMFYQLDYQYMENEEMLRIVGESANEFVRVSPTDVRKSFDFIPAGTFTMENKSQKGLRLIQFKGVTKDDPTIKQTVINRKIYEAMEIGDNADELMRTDAEMQEIMALAQKMAMQMVADQMAQAEGNKDGKVKGVPGAGGNSGQFRGGETTGNAGIGIPPVGANIPPPQMV